MFKNKCFLLLMFVQFGLIEAQEKTVAPLASPPLSDLVCGEVGCLPAGKPLMGFFC